MSEQDRKQSREPKSCVTRRTALAAAAAAPLSAGFALAADPAVELAARAAEKNAVFMRGDMRRWLELVKIAPDFTLMQPFGGPTTHGFDASPEHLGSMARYFRNGKTSLELVQAYASESIVLLAMIERQRAEVGGLHDQDWSLRVTEAYRKTGSEWELMHRHADLMVRSISLQQAALIARGQLPEG